MTAIAQAREARSQFGRGRYTLWTGDIGLAIYLSDCLTAEPFFPTIDAGPGGPRRSLPRLNDVTRKEKSK